MKIIKTLFVAAFALVAGYTVYSTQQNTEMSDLAMANVEALAQNESNPDRKYETQTKDSIEVWDETTGTYKKIVTIVCEGIGSISC